MKPHHRTRVRLAFVVEGPNAKQVAQALAAAPGDHHLRMELEGFLDSADATYPDGHVARVGQLAVTCEELNQ